MTTPTTVESIKKSLVALKMATRWRCSTPPCAGSSKVRSMPLEALDQLLLKEVTLRESRRIEAALMLARLTAIKTLAGFDFAFQPSLDRSRLLALVHRTGGSTASAGAARHGQEPSSVCPCCLGPQGRPERLLLHPRRHRGFADQGRA